MTNPLNPLYDAVAWVMEQIHTGLSTFLPPAGGITWVLTIVILVVLMRLLLVPLFIKQMHATRKMSALAPQIQELRKKYKNDKQTLNQETMRLYKENGANPLAGCLPLLGQLPLFFALFSVLRAISVWHPGQTPPYGLSSSVVLSAQHADIFGATISDKFLFSPTTPLHAKIVILIAVMVLNLLAMLYARRIMAGAMILVLQIFGAVLGVLQVALSIREPSPHPLVLDFFADLKRPAEFDRDMTPRFGFAHAFLHELIDPAIDVVEQLAVEILFHPPFTTWPQVEELPHRAIPR